MTKKENKPAELKPAADYRDPVYPEKEVFTRSPGLLMDYAPSSWLMKKASAAALLVLTLSAHPVLAVEPAGNVEQAVGQKDERQDRQEVREEKALIAPLFIHGDGIGSTGCVVVSPPVFLSEADAFEVIAAALEKEGIVFDKRVHFLDNTYSVDALSKQYFVTKDMDDAGHAKKIPFYFDLYSTEYNLGIKFISKDNHGNFAELRSLAQDEKELRKIRKNPQVVSGIALDHSSSSVQGYDMIKVSQRIREYLREHGGVNAVLFYDPMVTSGWDFLLNKRDNREIEELVEISQHLLEQQVEDFGRWFRETLKKSDETGEKEIRQ